MKDNTKLMSNISKRKKILFIVIGTFLISVLCLLIGEVLIRNIPISGTYYKKFKYAYRDSLTGGMLRPNAIRIYRNDKGGYTERKYNNFGYLDENHTYRKKEGIIRIGFFGDSYTEAAQVNLEKTFFKRIELCIERSNIECLAFGFSGFSTLQSYLLSEVLIDSFDIDIIVYVFCENDLGDQLKVIKGGVTNIPFAFLHKDSLKIDYSFRDRIPEGISYFKKIKRILIANSYLLTTLRKRLKLLYKYGIKTKRDEEERMMLKQHDGLRSVNQNDLPSSWPDSLLNYAVHVESVLLHKWKNEVEKKSKIFVILYVPRKGQWQKEIHLQDSWKPWLSEFCSRENINFIDPTGEFKLSTMRGKSIYYDHFTVDGHEAFANAFINWYNIFFKKIGGIKFQ